MQKYWFYLGLITDAVAFFSPLVFSSSKAAFLGLLLAHVTACALIAAALLPILPRNYRQQKGLALAFLFTLGFMAPIVGSLGVVLLVRLTLADRRDHRGAEELQILALPELDLWQQDNERTSQGAIRSRLNPNAPEQVRLQSILTLQAVPQRLANPILVDLLSDEVDDIRLIAFGMLDAKEKALTQLIHAEQRRLASAQKASDRFASLRRLAELHWELVYASLAQDELRQYMLKTAADFLHKAEQFPEAAQDALLAKLAGQVYMAQGDYVAAKTALKRALALGQPKSSILPYLAEIAYLERDYAHVRRLMRQLANESVKSNLRLLIDLWTGRDSSRVFYDRHTLPHL